MVRFHIDEGENGCCHVLAGAAKVGKLTETSDRITRAQRAFIKRGIKNRAEQNMAISDLRIRQLCSTGSRFRETSAVTLDPSINVICSMWWT